jgi:outer membrane protein TolC
MRPSTRVPCPPWFVALALVAAPALAESPTGLTLDAAIARALDVSARSDAFEARFRAALAASAEARSDRKPLVGLGASYARMSHVPELTIVTPVGSNTIFPDLPNRYEASLGFHVPLLTGGRSAARIRAADDTAVASGADLDAVRRDLVLEVRRAYWDLVGRVEAVRVLTESLATYDAHLDEVRTRRDVGLAAENDVLAVEVDRDGAELGRIEAAGAAAVARAVLARLLDLPDGRAIEAIDRLSEPEAVSAPTADLVAEAWSRRPERAALASRIRAAEATVDAVHAALEPQATIDASFDYANPNLRVLPLDATWEDTWRVGIGASIRLFDGGRTKNGVARARAEVDALRAELVDLERRVGLDVAAAREAFDAAMAGIPVADRGLRSARENRRVAADRYREGVIPSSELLDAESRLLFAGLGRTETLVRSLIAEATLDRAMGR